MVVPGLLALLCLDAHLRKVAICTISQSYNPADKEPERGRLQIGKIVTGRILNSFIACTLLGQTVQGH